jgi:hypothetical protein
MLCHRSIVLSLAFFPRRHLFVALPSPVGECFSAPRPLTSPSFRVFTCPLLCPLQFVGASSSLSLHVLTCPSLCALQQVSAPLSLACFLSISSIVHIQNASTSRSLSFFPCPHLSVALPPPGSEFPSLVHFLSLSSLVRRSALSRT